jgi:hypothetical protein
MKAIAIQKYAEGDPMRTGEHFIVNALKEVGDGLVVVETSAGWKQLQPFDGSADGKWYDWIDGPAGEVNNWNRGRVNGQLLAMNPHGDKPFVFGWCEVEV